MPTALLLIDFINDIVHPQGKLAAKGYAHYIEAHHTFTHLATALTHARAQNMLIVHVQVGFSPHYLEQPKHSPLFGKAHEFQALQIHTWATAFHEAIEVHDKDIRITKHRVNAFYGTSLDLILKNNNIQSLLIAGVATDLAVSSTARDAHDRDYSVTILADCCAAANNDDHIQALTSLQKIAHITTIKEMFS